MLRNDWVKRSAVLSALSAMACGAGPRMVAPGDVAEGSRVLEVQNRKNATGAMVDESFDLGGFRVAEVNRKWDSKRSAKVGGYAANKTKSGYTFQLVGNQTWQGTCAAVNKEKSAGSLSWGGESEVVCQCESGSGQSVARLGGRDPKRHDKGEVELAGEKLQVALVDATDKSNLTGRPAGYRVDGEQGAVGAVEILHPGQVWLAKDLSEPDAEALSCLFAGWMLYRAPSDF